MKFKKKLLTEIIAVSCRTEKQAEALLKWADANGERWIGGESYLEEMNYHHYGSETCYCLFTGGFGSRGAYKLLITPIISFEEAKENVAKKNKNKTKESKMIEKLQEALRTDKELFETYKSNIAIEFQDEVARLRKRNCPKSYYLSKADIHFAANKAAENFLSRFMKNQKEA
jgi:hypothetical protein